MTFESLDQFTLRQQDILQILARLDGSSNRDIGTELGVTEKTVKVYIGQLFDKADIRKRNRTALSVFARSIVPEPDYKASTPSETLIPPIATAVIGIGVLIRAVPKECEIGTGRLSSPAITASGSRRKIRQSIRNLFRSR